MHAVRAVRSVYAAHTHVQDAETRQSLLQYLQKIAQALYALNAQTQPQGAQSPQGAQLAQQKQLHAELLLDGTAHSAHTEQSTQCTHRAEHTVHTQSRAHMSEQASHMASC
jgi:hypothetical protein